MENLATKKYALIVEYLEMPVQSIIPWDRLYDQELMRQYQNTGIRMPTEVPWFGIVPANVNLLQFYQTILKSLTMLSGLRS